MSRYTPRFPPLPVKANGSHNATLCKPDGYLKGEQSGQQEGEEGNRQSCPLLPPAILILISLQLQSFLLSVERWAVYSGCPTLSFLKLPVQPEKTTPKGLTILLYIKTIPILFNYLCKIGVNYTFRGNLSQDLYLYSNYITIKVFFLPPIFSHI